MTMDLNKIYNGDLLWETDDYRLMVESTTGQGYSIVNKHTAAVEGFVDQEPAGVLSMLYLQEAYEEVMPDPLREYKLRKQRQAGGKMSVSRGGSVIDH